MDTNTDVKEWGLGISCNFSSPSTYQKDVSKLRNLTAKISATKEVINNFNMKYEKLPETIKSNNASSSKYVKNMNTHASQPRNNLASEIQVKIFAYEIVSFYK